MSREAILRKFKVAQLTQLAFLCGEKTSGSKQDIVERLIAIKNHGLLGGSSTPKNQHLILSIDMGIRNLGYSLLAPAQPPMSPTLPTLSTLGADDLRQPMRVHLHAWQRRELLDPLLDNLDDPERYSPASLAIAADRLVRQDLLPLKPTHILIERQRWRSGGAAAVQEWTLRVNTLEAMLHASLRTLRELGQWDGEIVSVAPDRVTRFFPPPPPVTATSEESSQDSGGRSAKGVVAKVREEAKSQPNSKKHKISVLASWLTRERGSEVILPANRGVEDAVKQFRTKLAGGRRSRVKKPIEDEIPKKLDDLTDSLLQGVAWLKWQENKTLILRDEELAELANWDSRAKKPRSFFGDV
ncbi:hypothetical protein M426DRAFT_11827 [Hypoxylon sp. CI-4A]|nr:hypothetical protein M426DRAFT_11827 [Hypoxylon sp. CI-4A]